MRVSKNPRRIKLIKPKYKDRFIETNIAARRANTSRQTIINWCKKYDNLYGLGVKRGGRWKIDPDKLQLLINGNETGLITAIAKEKKSAKEKDLRKHKKERMLHDKTT